MKHLSLIATSVAFFSAVSILSADPLFTFAGDYGAGNSSNARTATGSGSGPYLETVAFDDSTVMSPSLGYTGPAFYGGFQFGSSTVDGSMGRQGVRDYASGDSIYLQSYHAEGWVGSELSLHVAIVFKQKDWLPGCQSGSNRINGLSISTNGFGAGAGRFIVQTGGKYYVSRSVVAASGKHSLDLDATALASETWAPYEPASELNFDQRAAAFVALDLHDVTAVGFYVERDNWTGSGTVTTPFGMGIQTLRVTGTAASDSSQTAQ